MVNKGIVNKIWQTNFQQTKTWKTNNKSWQTNLWNTNIWLTKSVKQISGQQMTKAGNQKACKKYGKKSLQTKPGKK